MSAGRSWTTGGTALVSATTLVGLAIGAPAFAFDCKKGVSPIEKATCADTAAKESDDAMSSSFAALKAKLDPDQVKMLLADQRSWLKSRAADFVGTDVGKRGAFITNYNMSRAKALAGQAEAGPGLAAPLSPVFVDRAGSPKGYEVRVMLYRSGSSRKIETLDRLTAEALSKIPKAVEDPQDGLSYSYELRDKITYGDGSLLSIVRTGWQFDGGAHGQSSTRGFNIDLGGGRMFEMSDFLSTQGLKDVTNLCRTQLRKQGKDKLGEARDGGTPPTADERKADAQSIADVETAAGPLIANLGSWHFEASRAVIDFDADTIAPHALGGFECEIPFEVLKGRVKAGFPLP